MSTPSIKVKQQWIFRPHAAAELEAGTITRISPSGDYAAIDCEDRNIIVEIAKAEWLEQVTPAKPAVPQAQQPPPSPDDAAKQQQKEQQQQ